MTRWTALDVLICVGPFIVIAGFAAHAIRADRGRVNRVGAGSVASLTAPATNASHTECTERKAP